ncbi:MAG: metallophosphoesterase [Lentisphaeraceae bacterium]|nr:metallophosphoesterase [Lentisphaeraceae bacterium]
MKILHFSDIHTGGHLTSVRGLFDKRIIGTLNYKFRRRRHVHWSRLEKAIEVIELEKPDVVINTGDITSVSEPAEFQEALERLRPLTENKSFDFLNVPGNHDYYVNDPQCLRSRNSTYNELNRGNFPLETFPCRFEKKGVVFIMIDESKPNSGTQSMGRFKLDDLAKIKTWIDEAGEKPVILVGHYPLRDKMGQHLSHRRSLENGEELFLLLENGRININLCGHIHAAFLRVEKSKSWEVCAGSLTIGGRMNKLEYNDKTKEFSHSWITV